MPDDKFPWSTHSCCSKADFLFLEGKLAMDVPKTMDASYTAAQGFNLPQSMREAGKTSQETLVRHNLTQGAFKYAFRARSAPWCHVAESPDFFCPFCRRECRSWGGHITQECFVSSVASFLGFIAAPKILHAEGWSLDRVTIESTRFSKKKKFGLPSLAIESRLTNGGKGGQDEVLLSKSGLIRMHEKGPCNLAVIANVAKAFLEAIGAWLRMCPFQHRHYRFGKKPPGWPRMIGTPWAYLICATAIAHACTLHDVRFEGIDSGWEQDSMPAGNKGHVVMLELPGSGNMLVNLHQESLRRARRQGCIHAFRQGHMYQAWEASWHTS